MWFHLVERLDIVRLVLVRKATSVGLSAQQPTGSSLKISANCSLLYVGLGWVGGDYGPWIKDPL